MAISGTHLWRLFYYVKNYGWKFVTLYRRQWSSPSPRKRNAKRQNGCLRRPYKQLRREEKQKAKEKWKDIPIWMQSSKNSRRDKKAFLSDQWKEMRKTTEWERLEISSRKLEIPKKHFMQRWAQKWNNMDLTEAEDIKKRCQEYTEELFFKKRS